jgi:hypothetical protein
MRRERSTKLPGLAHQAGDHGIFVLALESLGEGIGEIIWDRDAHPGHGVARKRLFK